MNYYDNHTNLTENLAVELLSQCGVTCQRNNLADITAVDIITDSGAKIDAQFSKNFSRYGDYRLDIVSAFTPRNVTVDTDYTYQDDLNFIKNFEQKFNCNVLKVGKLLQKDYLDYLFILFHNGEFKPNPDVVLLISKADLIDYIKPQKAKLFQKIKLNNKFNLNDTHGSAFIPINVAELAKHTESFFGSVDDMLQNKQRIQQYLIKYSGIA